MRESREKFVKGKSTGTFRIEKCRYRTEKCRDRRKKYRDRS